MEAWLNSINHAKTSHDFSSFVLALINWASAITFSAVLAALQASLIKQLIRGENLQQLLLNLIFKAMVIKVAV